MNGSAATASLTLKHIHSASPLCEEPDKFRGVLDDWEEIY